MNYKKYTVFFLLVIQASCVPYGNIEHPSLTPFSQMTILEESATPSKTLPPISQTVTPIPSQTLEALPTSFPVLSAEDAFKTIGAQIQSNLECMLPCWLGIIPGQTRFKDAGNIFSQYQTIARTEFSSKWVYLKVDYPTHGMTTHVYPGKEQEASRILVETYITAIENETAVYTDRAYRNLWQNFSIQSIFGNYGKPDEIFLDTTLVSADPSNSYPFALWVVYSDKGFFLRYAGVNEPKNESVRICPSENELSLHIWDTAEFTYTEILADDQADGVSSGPQPISRVTDLTIDSFFEKFESSEEVLCFETPSIYWNK